MTQIKQLMLKNNLNVDEALYFFLKENRANMTASQKSTLFLKIISNFPLQEGVLSSVLEMIDQELPNDARNILIKELQEEIAQRQRIYYALKIKDRSEYFIVLKKLEQIDKSYL